MQNRHYGYDSLDLRTEIEPFRRTVMFTMVHRALLNTPTISLDLTYIVY